MKKDHFMSQTIVDLQYPHFTDKKIMKLRQSGDLNEGILKVFPSLKPPHSVTMATHFHLETA
jgi:hypothetical protein